MKIVKHEFNSLSEIPAWLDAHPNVVGKNCASQDHDNSPSDSWDMNLGYAGSIEMLRNGGNWAEGAAKMKEVTVTMANLKRSEPSLQLDTDVCGFAVDVGSYLAGDPCCMWNEGEDDSRPVPIIKIGVNVFMSAAIDSQWRMNYGAAILSVIDSIEATGARVELWSTFGTREGYSKKTCTDFRVLLKPAHEHWSPASVAFALSHAAFTRRVMFRVAESFKSLQSWCSECYGMKENVNEADFDLYFEPLTYREFDWAKTEKGALEYVTKLAQGQLNQQEKAA
jgi:hypothetical protein